MGFVTYWNWVAKRSFNRINQPGVISRRVLSSQDARDLLGVSPGATKEELKNAYLEKVKIYHPDKQSGNAAMFRKVRKAYKLLDGGGGRYSSRAGHARQGAQGGYQTYNHNHRRAREAHRRQNEQNKRRAEEQRMHEEEFRANMRRVWWKVLTHMRTTWANFASLKEGEFKWVPLILGTVPFAFVMWYLYATRDFNRNSNFTSPADYSEHQLFSIQAEKVFRKISKRRDNTPYPTLLHDYQAHILSYRQIPPNILTERDVVYIDKLLKRFPSYAADLLDNPAVPNVTPLSSPYVVGVKSSVPDLVPEDNPKIPPRAPKSDVKPVKEQIPGEPIAFRMFADFDKHDLHELANVYNSGDIDRALHPFPFITIPFITNNCWEKRL